METLYIKKEDGSFEEKYVGFQDRLPDGIWVIETKKGSRSIKSAAYLVGNLKQPCDLVTIASIHKMHDDLAQYMIRLGDENSEEFQDAKNSIGGYLQGPVSIYNISPSDLATLFLRHVAKHIGEEFPKRTKIIW